MTERACLPFSPPSLRTISLHFLRQLFLFFSYYLPYRFLLSFLLFFPPCLSTTCVWDLYTTGMEEEDGAVREVRESLENGNLASMGIQLTHGKKPQSLYTFFYYHEKERTKKKSKQEINPKKS